MEPDIQKYCANLVKEYSIWARRRLPKYMDQSGTRAVEEISPEQFLFDRRVASRKIKRDRPDSLPSEISPEQMREEFTKSETLPILDIIEDAGKPNVLLLGDAGMGKTSLSWVVARRDAKKILDAPDGGIPLPIRYGLAAYKRLYNDEGLCLEAQLGRHLAKLGLFAGEKDPAEPFRRLLGKTRLRLMLDGINEIEGQARRTLGEDIVALSARAASSGLKHFICVSSRIHEGVEQLHGFAPVELHSLGIDAVRDFARMALGEKSKAFLDQIDKRRLDRMAGVPLFLFLLVKLFGMSEEEEVPPNRGMILQKVLEKGFLIEHEDEAAERRFEHLALSGEKCSDLLELLAYNALDASGGLELRREEIKCAIAELKRENPDAIPVGLDEAKIIDALCAHGVLEKHDADVFTFWHPVFRDYFAGKRVAALWKNLAKIEDKDRFIRDKIKYTRWDEALSVAVGIGEIEQSQDLFDCITKIIFVPSLPAMLFSDNRDGIGRNKDKLDPNLLYKKLKRLQKHRISAIKARAFEVWGKVGTSYALNSISLALKVEKRYNVIKSAIYALKNIETPEAEEAFLSALKHKDSTIQFHAYNAIEKIGTPETGKTLMLAFNEDESEFSRRIAAGALRRIGTPEAEKALLLAFKEEVYSARSVVARELGVIGTPEAEKALLQALKDDKSEWIRTSVVKALGNIGTPEAEKALYQALKDKNGYVRNIAAEALGKIGTPEAEKALLGALKDEVDPFRSGVINALGNIQTPEVEKVLLLVLKDDKSDWIRSIAAKAMGNIRTHEVEKALLRALKDGNYSLRMSAADALGNIGTPEAEKALLQVLKNKDNDSGVRSIAAESLGDIGTPEAMSALLNALKDEDGRVRRFTVSSLKNIGTIEAVPALLQALKDKDSIVREYAAEALGNINYTDRKTLEDVLNRSIKLSGAFHFMVTREKAWKFIFSIEEHQGVRWIPEYPWWKRNAPGWITSFFEDVLAEIKGNFIKWVAGLIVLALIVTGIVVILRFKPDWFDPLREWFTK